jgi:putative hydrolase of the HAD superfamily
MDETVDPHQPHPAGGQPTPQFIYFDLGNVLLQFDHDRAARQMAEVAGTTPERVWEIVFAGDLELRYERGEISTADFHEVLCRQTGTTPPLAAILNAASDIFEPNPPVISLLGQLQRNGHRLGLLSNTNDAHWSFIKTTFPDLLRAFDVIALSFELNSLKPEPGIYAQAARLAGLDPAQILFVDDRPENVSSATEARFDAIQFQGHRQLVADLVARNLGPLM